MSLLVLFCALNYLFSAPCYLSLHLVTYHCTLLPITELGLSERDVAHKAEIMRPGYKLFEHQRVRRKGGGIARLLNETVDGRKVDSGEHRSFEFG